VNGPACPFEMVSIICNGHFKLLNACVSKLKTVVIDKDFTERNAISKAFKYKDMSVPCYKVFKLRNLRGKVRHFEEQ
jgi:hypothetical protein